MSLYSRARYLCKNSLDRKVHDRHGDVFVAVAEAGSFRAGAKRLSRVQSAVSHAIGNLEAELGVTLFDRSSHRPTLTSDGRALLADGRAILLKVDLMRAGAGPRGAGWRPE
jgi:DNA-binding transcriptional LysR family regulator